LLVNLILSACAPVSAPTPTPAPSATPLPTATTAPTSTATPTSTPTATPTATPTPIPTIQVGNLSVPDPRITNPELFNLTKPDAPIPQFVNAMKMAGIEITAEQVAQGITYKALKDKDGNPFVVACYNLDPSLFPEQYRDLAGPIPLMIAERGENVEWRWSRATPRKLMDISGKMIIGVFANPQYDRPESIFSDNFNALQIGAFSWDWVRRKGKDINLADFSLADKWVNFAIKNNMSVMNGNPLVYHHGLPDWLTKGNFSKDELTKIMTEHIETNVRRYLGKPITWQVLNEAVWYYQGHSGYSETIWYNTIGKEYVDIAFRSAREADPTARLIYNDFTNNVAGKGGEISGPKADVVFNFVEKLKKKGLVDGVGIQLHIFDPETAPSEEEIRNQIERYKKIGVDVYFTEVTFNIKPLINRGIPLREALIIQADFYRLLAKACATTEGCKAIYIGGLDDKDLSWPEPNTQALLFSERTPKLAFFGLTRGMMQSLIE